MTKRKRIAIFGAGKAGKDASRELSKTYDIQYFVDNAKNELVLKKYPCFGPSILKSNPVDFIFICSMYANEIKLQLLALGHRNFQIFKSKKYSSEVKGPYRRLQIIKKEESPLYLIYQVGKVGSNTVLNALKCSGHRAVSFHTFRSSDIYAQWGLKPTGLSVFTHFISIINPWLAKKALQERKLLGRETIFITGIREPISRAISILMQSLHILMPQHMHRAHTSEEDFLALFTEMFYRWIDFDYFLNWLDDEFRYITGCDDIYHAQAFDIDKGIGVVDGELGKVIIYRQDKLNDLIANNFHGYIPTCEAQSLSGNRSQFKWYAELAKELKGQFFVDKALAEKIYNSNYCQAFFSRQEREHFFRKWTHDAS